MEPMNRDLLFAALAARTSFVDRETLKQSLASWESDQSIPLEERLVESGDVSESTRQVLSAVVDEHLRMHGEQLDEHLATMIYQPNLASEFEQAKDATIKNYLSQVIPPEMTRVMPGAKKAALDAEKRYEDVANVAFDAEYGRFRLQKALAKGGIGEIYRARDLELSRDVALKRIQNRHASEPFFRDRFMLEAEVTGALEHPNIVPVYGLGVDSAGQPYYAMRLIEGKSLAQHVAELYGFKVDDSHHAETQGADQQAVGDETRTPDALKQETKVDSNAREPSAAQASSQLPHNGNGKLSPDYDSRLRRLLNRFVQVCQAIHYAHSRGILHRDIKPDNVMLGPYGETLVLDWGLAKVMDDKASKKIDVDSTNRKLTPESSTESTPTLDGTLVGTVAYMSPEQSLGWHDSLGPASDVYSLGATLYTILVGRPSVTETDLNECLMMLQSGEIDDPRHLNRQIPPALSAICRKAMAKTPSQRYPSALALADDLEAYLSDEPVTAFQDPLLARAGRWARKHRSTATGIGVATLLILVSLSIGLMMMSASRKKEERLKEEAIAERNRAKEYFELARGSVDTYLNRITDDEELASADLQPLRVRLLETALEFYQQLADQEDDPLITVDRANALHRLGVIKDELGQFDEAKDYYEESLRLWRSFPEKVQSAPEGQFAISQSLANLALCYDEENDLEKRDALLKETEQILRAVCKEEPDNVEYLRGLGNVANNRGAMMIAGDDVAESARLLEESIDLRAKVVDSEEATLYDAALLMETFANLYVLHSRGGEFDKAASVLKRAEELATQYTNGDLDDDPYLQMAYINVLSSLATQKYDLGEFDAARPEYRKALEMILKLTESNSNVLKFSLAAANIEANLGIVESELGNMAEAKRLLDSAIVRRRQRYTEYPNDFGNLSGLGTLLMNRGSMAYEDAELDEAEALIEESIKHHSTLCKQFDDDPEYLADRAISQSVLARIKSAREDISGASEIHESLIATYRELSRVEPTVVRHRASLASTLQDYAAILLWEDTDVGIQYLDEAIALREALVEERNATFDVRVSMEGARILQATGFRIIGKTNESRAGLLKAVEGLRKLVDENENRPDAVRMLGLGYYHLGLLHSEVYDWTKAAEFYQLAADTRPDRPDFNIYFGLAEANAHTGDPVRSLEILEEHIDLFIANTLYIEDSCAIAALTFERLKEVEEFDRETRRERCGKCAELACRLVQAWIETGTLSFGEMSLKFFQDDRLGCLLGHPTLTEILNAFEQSELMTDEL